MTRCSDKPCGAAGKTELVGDFFSGLHGEAVQGSNLVTLFYGDERGRRVPVNYRAVDKAEGKTRNELFRATVAEVLGWGLRPAVVTADGWEFRRGEPQVPQETRSGAFSSPWKKTASSASARMRMGRWKALNCPCAARCFIFQKAHRAHWGIESYQKRSQGSLPCPTLLRALEEGHSQPSLAAPCAPSCNWTVARWRGEIASWSVLKRRLADAVVTHFIRQGTHSYSA